MSKAAQITGQNRIWTAAPYAGIPWLKAMLGCEVYGTASGFFTEPCLASINELEMVSLESGTSWLKKFVDLTKKLAFRKVNNLFTQAWSRHSIRSYRIGV